MILDLDCVSHLLRKKGIGMRVQSLLYLHLDLGHAKFIVEILGSPHLLHGRGGQAVTDSSLNTIIAETQPVLSGEC